MPGLPMMQQIGSSMGNLGHILLSRPNASYVVAISNIARLDCCGQLSLHVLVVVKEV